MWQGDWQSYPRIKIFVYMIDAFENMLYVRLPTLIPYTLSYNVLKMLQITSKVMVHL
jgi:hypothetical protein